MIGLFSLRLNTTRNYSQNLNNKITLFRFTIIILLLFWCLGILYSILFSQFQNKLAEFLFANLYSTVCHQQSAKCISIGNEQILVCARCTGIYFGALITAFSVFYLNKLKITEKLLLFVLLILCFDVLAVLIGIYNYSKIISFITGLLFGGTVYLYLMNELENFFFTSINKVIK